MRISTGERNVAQGPLCKVVVPTYTNTLVFWASSNALGILTYALCGLYLVAALRLLRLHITFYLHRGASEHCLNLCASPRIGE
jgi:hypothetical protein